MENNLKQIITDKGIKQGWLADRCGINKSTVTNLINGSEPRIKLAYKIAKELQVDIYEIWPYQE